MHTDINEYVPTPAENGQSNGHANGQPKKFGLTPVEDPDKQIVYQIRKQCHEDRELGFGARFYFSYLLDRATDNRTWAFRGAVLVSVKKLRVLLGCSKRVVYSWNKELVMRRYIWISKVTISSNMDPFNMYHITALNPPKGAAQKLSHDGMWGGETPRPRISIAPGVGGRDGKWRAENATEKHQNPSLFADNAPHSSKNGTMPAAENTTGSSTVDDSQSQSLRTSAVESAAGSRKNCGSPSQKTALITHTVSGNGIEKSTSKLSSKALTREEKDFLNRMIRGAEAKGGTKAAAFESQRFGKQWVARYREDNDRAERAYLDVIADLKEGKVIKSFGATWNIRWNEFASRKGAK